MRNLQSNIVPLVLVAAIVWGLTVAPVKHNVTGANKNFEYVVNGDDPLNPKNYLKISYCSRQLAMHSFWQIRMHSF